MLRYKEIKYQIERMISSMQPDEPLPSREALCRSLDTTRATLQKAISELAKEGMLYSKGGSGTFVSGTMQNPANANLFVGLVTPSNDTTAYRNLISGVEAYLCSQNINMVLCCTDGDIEKQSQCLNRLFQSGISGLIIVPAYCMDITKDYVLFSRLEQRHMPVIFCYRGIEGLYRYPLISVNNFHCGYIATKHLIEKGYRHITYAAQFILRTTMDRYQGYVAAMVEAKLEFKRNAIIFEMDMNGEDTPAYRETYAMLCANPQIDAILCNSDSVSKGVYQAISACGRRVSDDVGVLSIDNSETICNAMVPTLSSMGSVDINIGQKAAQMLLEIMHGQSSNVPFYLVPPRLIERESCKGPVLRPEERA